MNPILKSFLYLFTFFNYKILTKILYAIKINYSNKKKKVKIYRKKYDVED